jgi:hypothetical protein
MRSEISAREWSQFFRTLAQKRWQSATRDQRFLTAQHASRARWAKFAQWKESHALEAAAASAIAKVLRILGSNLRVSDDDLVQRLEARLQRAKDSSSVLLPWGEGFKHQARRRPTQADEDRK